ncbi:Hypothetical predicted protein [Mytilus galloprovincialis]|uniref:Calcineurin-like phosphoesterase domain-containing protein n=2 Tax=Mytilus galloprovincialis TaxID=29158 RepID=A0A8B6CC59_MYTGA|nr:Hypothetical predicted protein [Mytilus galloprovincialis]
MPSRNQGSKLDAMAYIICQIPGIIFFYFRTNKLVRFIILVFLLVFYCEFLHYYFVLLMCKWPTLPHQQAEGTIGGMKSPPLKAMIIADTHILGWREGHWLDRIRREWMMEKSFQASMTIHNPQVVFMLGDLLDEGKWCSSKEFNFHVKRFKKMFKVPSGTDVYTVAGNHDIGFHYMISDYNRRRFDKAFSTSPVQMVHIDGVTFVLLNSMAMEGDGCNLCSQAINDLEDISWELKCAKGISEGKEMPAVCNGFNKFKYSQPILLQHFPMYRPSDANCTVPDAAPLDEKYIPFREKWDCLSQEASKQLFEWINPRLIISGHTHHGCYVLHNEVTPEWTVSSFSWRNKKNPSFLLAVITGKNFEVSQCYLPNEYTIFSLYITGILIILISLLFPRRQPTVIYDEDTKLH